MDAPPSLSPFLPQSSLSVQNKRLKIHYDGLWNRGICPISKSQTELIINKIIIIATYWRRGRALIPLGYGLKFPTEIQKSLCCRLNKTRVKNWTISTSSRSVFQWYKEGKEENVLFNDALNTFYLRLYGVRHMVKDHSDSERGNPLPPHGLLFREGRKCFI